MFFVIIVMIVIIGIFIGNYNNLSDENERLKKMLANKINFCPNCGVNLVNYDNGKGNNKSVSNDNFSDNGIVICEEHKKHKYNDAELKNTLILVVGSVLIILSAIVFLTSTWNVVSNVVKIFVILLMLLLFLGVSYVADKYLKLKQTSKTFYYIALAYIPIVLLAIAMFSLFGKYFSLYGMGRYIYLFVSSVLVAGIYYYNAKWKDSKLISIFSIVFQILSVVFFVLMFTEDKSMIMLGLVIYNLVINLFYINNKVYFNKELHLRLCGVFTVSLGLIVFNNNIFNVIYDSVGYIDIVLIVLLFVNIYITLVKNYNKINIYDCCYPMIIIFLFWNASLLFDGIVIRQLMVILAFVVVYLYNIIRDSKIKLASYISVMISFVLLLFYSSFMNICINLNVIDEFLIDAYILFFVFVFLSFVYYLFEDKYKRFSAYMVSGSLVILVFSICWKFGLDIVLVGYVALGLIICSMFVKGLEINLSQAFKWSGIIVMICMVIFGVNDLISYVLLYFIYFGVGFGYAVKNKDNLFKIISYVYLNIFLLSLGKLMEIDSYVFYSYVIPFTSLLFTLIEGIVPGIRSDVGDRYLILQYILSIVILNVEDSIYSFIVLLIINCCYIAVVKLFNKNKNYFYVSFIGMIPYIYISNLFWINSFNIMYYLSFGMLIFIGWLIYHKKDNMFIYMFCLYSFLHITCLEESRYIAVILLLIGSFICYLVKDNKIKDMFKGFGYVLGLVLYNFVISDLGIANISMFYYGIYIIFILLVTRGILKKYNTNYKLWEYIGSFMVCLMALFNYSSEFDGIVFVLFLTGIVIVCYIYKFGPVFLVCLVSILLNVLLLTRTFWVSIPWWIYILVVGSILISFAVYNEVNDKKKLNKDKVNNFKNYFDL